MKRFLAMILTLALVISCCPPVALQTRAATEGIYEYEIIDGEAIITAVDENIAGAITVPDTLGGCPVTGVDDWVFESRENLISVALPDSVRTIGEYAFAYCENLTTVKLGTQLTDIGQDAFYGSDKLTYNTYDNAYYLGNDAAPYSVLIKAVDQEITTCQIHPDTKHLYQDAFDFCRALTKIDIPEGVVSIGSCAFSECYQLQSLHIPASVQSISYMVFQGTAHLTAITVSEENPNYSSDATGSLFNKDKTTLLQVPGATEGIYKIPNTVQYIGDDAFNGCWALEYVQIPESVISIGSYVFTNCGSLTSIKIPASVTSIGYRLATWCVSLEEILVADGNPSYSSDGAVLFNKDKTVLIQAPTALSGEYQIPQGVKHIESEAFQSCINLNFVTIPDSVTEIGDYAFYDCSQLGFVTIPKSVQSIGTRAFSYCGSLKAVRLECAVSALSRGCFSDCRKLQYINIPDTVTSIDRQVFDECSMLTGVYYGGTQQQWEQIAVDEFNDPLLAATVYYQTEMPDFSQLTFAPEQEEPDYPDYPEDPDYPDYPEEPDALLENGYYYYTEDGEAYIVGCDETVSGDIVVPTSLGGCPVTGIEGSAFSENERLTSVTIPDCVTWVSSYAFDYSYQLTGIWVAESNPNYSSDASGVLFDKEKTELLTAPCGIAGSYTIPDSVIYIGDWAFEGCESLTAVTIPDGVTTIGAGAFTSCTALTSGTGPMFVTDIGGYAFDYCYALTEIRVDAQNPAYCSDASGVLYSKDKTVLMRVPSQLSGSYTIANEVTRIDESALNGCKKLTAITIPDTVTEIGAWAFEDCTKLTSVTIPSGVPEINYGTFLYCESLISVSIPVSVTEIWESAFEDCTNLTDVYYAGTEAAWSAVEIGELNECLLEAKLHFGTEMPDTPDVPDVPDVPDIPVAPGTPGELDGNGRVDVDDAIYLLQHVLMPQLFPVTQAADYDGNSDVNVDDAIYLLQHVLMPELFPLKGSAEQPQDVMTHDQYLAAELDTPVTVECYVQATQEWWNDTVNVYAQDRDGGYFIYEMACSEADAARLTPGTKIRVSGYKTEWAGLVEIVDGTFTFVENADTYIPEPLEITTSMDAEALIPHQGSRVCFRNMTVTSIEYRNGEPGDDIYVIAEQDGQSYWFTVERYLTAPDTQLYQDVLSLKVGDVVDLEGLLYWYNGPDTHLTSVTKIA